MALYTLTSKDDFARLNRLPSSDQTQLYNALGRDAGAGNNFFAKRAKSIDNAIGTTGAAIASAFKSGVDGIGGPTGSGTENIATMQLLRDAKTSMNDIAKKYGYNTYQDVWDARDAAQAAGDQATLDKIDNVINPELQNQANINAQKANEKAANYADYMQNNDVSKRINQDPGKFAGSAINTLSTAFDVMAPGAGVLANSVQGGIEGIADELEQSGLQNFNAERAAQNALVGTATGAVVGGLNKGVTNSLAKRGGNLFKGGNAITRGLNNLGSKTAAGRVGSTLATGAARGALSGAVGGATGAGLSAALNNQDVLGSALQGVSQGLQQGALAGGVMAGANMALSKTPIMQKINQANEDWKNSGDSFSERLNNTINSGESNFGNTKLGNWVGDKIDDASQVEALRATKNDLMGQSGSPLAANQEGGVVQTSSLEGSTSLGDEATPLRTRASIVPQNEQNVNTSETEVYRALTGDKKAAKQRLKDIKANTLRERAAEDLLNQVGTVKSSVAKADNMVENVKQFIDEGLTKPEEWQLASDAITGQNGVVSKMHRNLIQQAGDIDTFSGLGGKYGKGIGETIDYFIKSEGLVDSAAKGIKNEIMAALESLPSRTDGSITMADDAESVMKVVRELEAHRRNYLGQDSRNNSSANPYKDQNARVIKKTTSMLEDRIYEKVPDASTVVTPEAINELKNYFPGNDKWAKSIDDRFANIKTGKDLRAAQKRYVQTNDYLKSVRENYGTYGQRVGDAYGNTLSQALKKVPVVGGILAQATNTPFMNRRYADINSARADRLQGKAIDLPSNKVIASTDTPTLVPTQTPTTSTPGANNANNPATQIYNAIGRTEGLTNGEQARTANYISDAVQEANGGTLESLVGTPATGATSVYDSVYSTPTASATTGKSNSYFQATGDYWTDILGAALTSAIQDGDVDAFGPLYSMYQDALSKQGSSKDYSNPMNWSSSDRSDLLKAQNGLDQIDSLAQSYANAVGESGGNVVQGTLRGWANNLSGGNLDPAAENYVKQANSIGAGIIKNLVNLGSTEYDAARYVDYLPKLTDTKEQAAQKLQVLKDAYQNVINNLYAIYGA